jgi:hypothetical protein
LPGCICKPANSSKTKMAPTIGPKFGPILRTGVGSTAGAMADGSPVGGGGQAEARRPKTAGGKFPPVSSNLDRARHRTNPPRCATVKALAGAKGPEVIPLDDEDKFLDEGMSSVTPRPRKVGHTMPGKAAEASANPPSGTTQPRGGAAGRTSPPSKLHDNKEVEASKRPSTRSPATAALAHVSRQGKGGSSTSHADKLNAGNVMDDGEDDSEDESEPDKLGFGMQELYEQMMLPGLSAARFLAAASPTYLSQEDWADKFGSFVAGLHVGDSALETALALAAAGQAYLAIIGGNDTFFVLHGLRRWPIMKRSSINDGRIVAFEGETVQDNQPPDVWRFKRSDEDLFRLKGFEEIEPCPVSNFTILRIPTTICALLKRAGGMKGCGWDL